MAESGLKTCQQLAVDQANAISNTWRFSKMLSDFDYSVIAKSFSD